MARQRSQVTSSVVEEQHEVVEEQQTPVEEKGKLAKKVVKAPPKFKVSSYRPNTSQFVPTLRSREVMERVRNTVLREQVAQMASAHLRVILEARQEGRTPDYQTLHKGDLDAFGVSQDDARNLLGI